MAKSINLSWNISAVFLAKLQYFGKLVNKYVEILILGKIIWVEMIPYRIAILYGKVVNKYVEILILSQF